MIASLPDLDELHTIVFDFDGVFTDNKVWVSQDGMESVRCDRGDGLGVDLMRRTIARRGLDVALLILSKESNSVVATRASKLGIECHQQVDDKMRYMERYLAEHRPTLSDPWRGLVFLGNDLNDIGLIEKAGYSIAPQDAHSMIRARASVLLERSGGDGFVRAFVERLLGIDSMSTEAIYELVCNRGDRDQP